MEARRAGPQGRRRAGDRGRRPGRPGRPGARRQAALRRHTRRGQPRRHDQDDDRPAAGPGGAPLGRARRTHQLLLVRPGRGRARLAPAGAQRRHPAGAGARRRRLGPPTGAAGRDEGAARAVRQRPRARWMGSLGPPDRVSGPARPRPRGRISLSGRSQAKVLLVRSAETQGNRANSGAIAQLVERLHGMQEVRSSILLSSTFEDPVPVWGRDLLHGASTARGLPVLRVGIFREDL